VPEAKQPSPDAFGANAWLVDEMFDQFRRDPLSVSESWREFFEGYKPAGANLAGRPVLVSPAPVPGDEVATVDGSGNGAGAGVATLTAPPRAPEPQAPGLVAAPLSGAPTEAKPACLFGAARPGSFPT
jgi:2-oxoglutarate decarboxylase